VSSYRAIQLQGKGGLDQLKLVELPLEPPKPGELRIKVRAAGAGFTDITMRTSKYLFAPPWPFVLGYEVVGDVDALGDGVTGFRIGQRVCALTVHGAWAEYLTREADHFVPVPDGVDDGEAVALILNYVTAYQMVHRSAHVQPGQLVLVSGANGGVGTALLELCRIQGVRAVGAVSTQHFDYVRELGGEPIESRTRPLDVAVHEKFPDGVDVAFDVLGGSATREHIRATKKGGIVVGYGFMRARETRLGALRTFASLYLGARLAGRRGTFYGITALYRKDKQPLKEDLPKLLAMLAQKQLSPRIAARLPLLDGRRAQELLEKGGVTGKIVLVA
jgi:NADPH:quinone reductase-like Zn-dependent oxidoreductase